MMEEHFSLRHVISDDEARTVGLGFAQERFFAQFFQLAQRIAAARCVLERVTYRHEELPVTWFDAAGYPTHHAVQHVFRLDGVVRGEAPDVAGLMIASKGIS